MKQGSVLIGQRTLSLATGVGDGVLVVAVKTKTRNDLLVGGHYPSDYSVRGQHMEHWVKRRWPKDISNKYRLHCRPTFQMMNPPKQIDYKYISYISIPVLLWILQSRNWRNWRKHFPIFLQATKQNEATTGNWFTHTVDTNLTFPHTPPWTHVFSTTFRLLRAGCHWPFKHGIARHVCRGLLLQKAHHTGQLGFQNRRCWT